MDLRWLLPPVMYVLSLQHFGNQRHCALERHCRLGQIKKKKHDNERSVELWTDCDPSVWMLKERVNLGVRKVKDVRMVSVGLSYAMVINSTQLHSWESTCQVAICSKKGRKNERKKERKKRGQVVSDLKKMWRIPKNVLLLRQMEHHFFMFVTVEIVVTETRC